MDHRNVKPFARPLSEVFGDNPQLLYEMPKFQRVYTWNKNHWIAIGDEGHFLGSIIAIEPPSVFVDDP